MPRPGRVVVLSADGELQTAVKRALEGEPCHVVNAKGGSAFRGLLQRGVGLLIVDLELPADVLLEAAAAAGAQRALPVLLLVDPANRRQQQQLQYWRHLEQAPPVEHIAPRRFDPGRLRQDVASLFAQGRFLQGTEIIGQSAAIQTLRERILRIAATPVSTVLLIGETGTGKDLVAQAVHKYSERAAAPFVPINCAAIPENLLESELFGHERGAFTDAKGQHRGLFEQADGGTVFLDEIGEMSLAAQIRLLRVLEQREITRVGGSDAIPVDIRVVAATNKDLQEAVAVHGFRLDLYHRLKVVDLVIPPLRERTEDIPLLVDHFLDQFAAASNGRFPGFTDAALGLLLDYEWPGNVRELRNLIEHLVFLGPRRPVEPEDLLAHLEKPPAVQRHLPVPTGKSSDQSERELIYFALLDLKREMAEVRRLIEGLGASAPAPSRPIYELQIPIEEELGARAGAPRAVEPLRTLKDLEREAIQQALGRVGGNRKQAAGILGISPRTLYRKLDEYGLR